MAAWTVWLNMDSVLNTARGLGVIKWRPSAGISRQRVAVIWMRNTGWPWPIAKATGLTKIFRKRWTCGRSVPAKGTRALFKSYQPWEFRLTTKGLGRKLNCLGGIVRRARRA